LEARISGGSTPVAVVVVHAGIGPWDTGPEVGTVDGSGHRPEEAVLVGGSCRSCGGRRSPSVSLAQVTLHASSRISDR
jgi:hypothetical protein